MPKRSGASIDSGRAAIPRLLGLASGDGSDQERGVVNEGTTVTGHYAERRSRHGANFG